MQTPALAPEASSAPADTTNNPIVPDSPAALLDSGFWFGLGAVALKVAAIVVLTLIVLAVIARLKKRWVASVMDLPTLDKKRQRVLTVADLLGSVAKYVVWAIAIFSILEAIHLPIGPLLAGAGIAGLAIGFGAQTLVKDVISGLFLLFDDTIGIGDLITFNNEAATVEYVGLRLIKARKFDGEVMMIPAGEMRVFGNKSIGFARAIVPVELAYESDVEAGLAVLEAVATEWAGSEFARDVMLEEAPTVQALMALGESSVTARIIVQVRPGEQFQAQREMTALVKKRFDERGVEIPFPRRTVYVKSEGTSPEAAAAAGEE
ncbi:MAG: mechanosensitive ion channel family protein [Bacteroidota bacterium]